MATILVGVLPLRAQDSPGTPKPTAEAIKQFAPDVWQVRIDGRDLFTMSEAMAQDYLANKERVTFLQKQAALAEQEIAALKQADAAKGQQVVALTQELELWRRLTASAESDRDRYAALLAEAIQTAKKRGRWASALDHPAVAIVTKLAVPALTIFFSSR